jgi:hypothetical protein
LPDGSEKKAKPVPIIAPKVIILVTSLKRYVRSMMVLAIKDPTTPEMI